MRSTTLFHSPQSKSTRPAGPFVRNLSRWAQVALLPSLLAAGLVSPALALQPYAEEWSMAAPPEDVDVDPFGRIWVACDDDSIRVYTPTGGNLLFTFGGTGSGDGQFLTPYGIAFDSIGNAYICDYVGARLEKFASDGTFLQAWPIPSSHADHVAVDAADDVYVTGYLDASVHKYTSSGVPIASWTSPTEAHNSGVLVADGMVYVAQWLSPGVEQYLDDGTYSGTFDSSSLGGTDIEIDASSQLWICDYNNHIVRVFQTDGTPVDILGTGGSGPGEFYFPIGVAIGPDGSVYVADYGNARIQRFGDPVADVPEILGSPVGAPTSLIVSPNPCQSGAELSYVAPSSERVVVTLLDPSGRTVANLADGLMAAGLNRLQIRPDAAAGRTLAAGSYFVRVATARGATSTRLTLLHP